MAAPVDVLAVIRKAEAYTYDAGDVDHGKKVKAARVAVAEVIAELEKAHQIILIALNSLPPAAKRNFARKVIGAGLDGEGATRFHERRAALAAVGPQ